MLKIKFLQRSIVVANVQRCIKLKSDKSHATSQFITSRVNLKKVYFLSFFMAIALFTSKEVYTVVGSPSNFKIGLLEGIDFHKDRKKIDTVALFKVEIDSFPFPQFFKYILTEDFYFNPEMENPDTCRLYFNSSSEEMFVLNNKQIEPNRNYDTVAIHSFNSQRLISKKRVFKQKKEGNKIPYQDSLTIYFKYSFNLSLKEVTVLEKHVQPLNDTVFYFKNVFQNGLLIGLETFDNKSLDTLLFTFQYIPYKNLLSSLPFRSTTYPYPSKIPHFPLLNIQAFYRSSSQKLTNIGSIQFEQSSDHYDVISHKIKAKFNYSEDINEEVMDEYINSTITRYLKQNSHYLFAFSKEREWVYSERDSIDINEISVFENQNIEYSNHWPNNPLELNPSLDISKNMPLFHLKITDYVKLNCR